jgi:4-hydroxy-tetrahydrodipicolinate synthase
MKELKGIITVLITPFTRDNDIDFKGLEKNIEHQIESGVHAMMGLGSTGEYMSLSEEERIVTAEFVIGVVGKRLPVALGIAAETTAQTIKYAQHAEKNGADAVMISPPPYCKPDWEQIKQHVTTVCKSISIPVIFYNNKFTSGVDTLPEQIIEMLNTITNLIYVKDSSGEIQRTRDIKLLGPKKTNTLCGWEDLALEAFFAGANGWISVCANVAPKLCISLYENAVKGDYKNAWKDYFKMLPFLRFLETSGKLVQAAKYALDMTGFAGGPNRAPRLELHQDEKNEVLAALRHMELLV